MEAIGEQVDSEVLKKYVDKFSAAKVLVVGDLIMDRYIWGDVSRISPEAPVPVVEINRETEMLGGAANVIRNVSSLGAKPILCGVIGDDDAGKEILKNVRRMGLLTDGIIVENGRKTSIKTRVLAHNQQVVRVDRETRKDIEPENITLLLKAIERNQGGLDAIVVSDYGKGVISAPLMKKLRELVESSGAIICVDPKTDNFAYYKGVDIITPNHLEAGNFCRLEILDQETLLQAGRQMLEELDCRSVLITQGKDGMTLFEKEGEISHIPTVARKVYDVTGAGDTVIGTLCLGLASGLDLKSAAIVSNFAAGIVVGEVGTSSVEAEILKKAIDEKLI